jgi:hypothetical protein
MIQMGRRQVNGVDHPAAFGDHLGSLSNATPFTTPPGAFLTCPGDFLPIGRIQPAILHPLASTTARDTSLPYHTNHIRLLLAIDPPLIQKALSRYNTAESLVRMDNTNRDLAPSMRTNTEGAL